MRRRFVARTVSPQRLLVASLLWLVPVRMAWAAVTVNTTAEDGTVSVWFQAGASWRSTSVTLGGDARRLILADPLQRGTKDLYVAASSGLFRVCSTPTGLAADALENTRPYFSVAAGDVDRSGKVSIIGGDDYLVRRFGYAGGAWNMVKVGATGCANYVTVGDFDGKRRCIIGDWTGKQNPVGLSYEWIGTEFVARPIDGGCLWFSNAAKGGADVDGDGIADSVVVGTLGIAKYDFAGANGAPRRTIITKNDRNNRCLAIGRFDGTGRCAVAVCSDPPPGVGTPSLGIWNCAAGDWRCTEIDSTVTVNGLDAFDLDGDGVDELVGAAPSGEIVLWKQAAGTFRRTVLVRDAKLVFTDVAVGDIGVKLGPVDPGRQAP